MGAEMRNDVRNYITQDDGRQWANMADGLVAVDMTHSNLQRRMAEIRFDLHMTIWDVKVKISTHCGTPAGSQRLVLKDGGQPIAHMDDDSKMLGYYSVESGMEIHIIDTDPFSQITTKALEDVSQIEKYRMSDEAYEQRQGTVRQYIKQQKAIHGSVRVRQAGRQAGRQSLYSVAICSSR